MRITVGNVYSKVTSYTNAEDALLSKILCVSVPNYRFMTAYKNGHWDGTKRFYSAYKSFPSGFLPFVIEQAHKHKFVVETDDQRNVPGLQDPSRLRDIYPQLREYQRHGLMSILTSTIQSANQVLPWQRGVVKYPTGSGKTVLAACLIDFIGKKTLYVIERKELMYQTYEAFKPHTGRSSGVLGDGHEQLDNVVTFAMAQTLRSRLETLTPFLKSIECLVIDETQHLAQGIYHKIATKCNSPFRFGFSATPLQRGDLGDVYLIGDTGEIIAEGDREEITSQGYLAKPKVYMFEVTSPQIGECTYKHAYQVGIVENDSRNEMVAQAAQKLQRRGCTILVLVRYVEHGKLLYGMLKRRGLRCRFIHGSDTTDIRKDALKDIGKTFDILVSTSILDEGIDLPELDALIRAGGGQSHIKTLQQVGRTLRPKTGRNEVFIVDFLDRTQKYLWKHANERLDAYKAENFAVSFPTHI